MFILLGTLAVLVAAVLIFVVVIQNSKGGGLSSAFGATSGATQLLGARRSNEAIEKITWYLAGGLALIAFLTNVVGTGGTTGSQGPLMRESIENQVIENPTAVPDLQNLGGEADPNAPVEVEPATEEE